ITAHHCFHSFGLHPLKRLRGLIVGNFPLSSLASFRGSSLSPVSSHKVGWVFFPVSFPKTPIGSKAGGNAHARTHSLRKFRRAAAWSRRCRTSRTLRCGKNCT